MSNQAYEVDVTIKSKDREVTVSGELTTDQSDPVAVARDVRDALKRGIDTYREIDDQA